MGRDDIILAQLDRIESKVDRHAEKLEEMAKVSSSNSASIGFLKASVTSLFTAVIALVGFFIKYK